MLKLLLLPALALAFLAACASDKEDLPDDLSGDDAAADTAAATATPEPPAAIEQSNAATAAPATCVDPPYGTPSGRLEDIRPPCSLVESHESIQSPEEALAQDIALIAEGQGWTIDQAWEQHRVSETMHTVINQIVEVSPDVFILGALSEEPGGTPTVYIKGPADDVIRRIIGNSGIEIHLADNQPYSRDELQARQDAVGDALRALGFQNFGIGSMDGDGDWRIDTAVTLEPGLPSDKATILAALPEWVRDDVDLTLSKEPVAVLE